MNSDRRNRLEMLKEFSEMLGDDYSLQVADEELQQMIDEQINEVLPNFRPKSPMVHYKIPDVESDRNREVTTACGNNLVSVNYTTKVKDVTCRKCKRNKKYKQLMSMEKMSFEF